MPDIQVAAPDEAKLRARMIARAKRHADADEAFWRKVLETHFAPVAATIRMLNRIVADDFCGACRVFVHFPDRAHGGAQMRVSFVGGSRQTELIMSITRTRIHWFDDTMRVGRTIIATLMQTDNDLPEAQQFIDGLLREAERFFHRETPRDG